MADLAKAWPRRRAALAWGAALALACCLAATHSQVKYWRDNTALYEHALKATPDNYMAHANLGDMLMTDGKLDEAAKQFEEAIRIHPSDADTYNELGKVYVLKEKVDDAMAMFLKAVTANPGLAQAHWNLGNAYIVKGKIAAAITELKIAVQLSPDDIDAQKKLAEVLTKTGKAAEAIPYCEAMVKARPEDAGVHFALGTACLAQKRLEEAVANFKEASRLAPNNPQCINALAWIYATCPKAGIRNGPEAVRLATQACKLTHGRDIGMLDTLAAACAEAGRFDEAVQTAEEIRTLAVSAHKTNIADVARQRLELYKAGKPYRDE